MEAKIREIIWPHPFDGEPNQVAVSSGLPPEGKVFVMPLSLFTQAILKLITEARIEELGLIHWLYKENNHQSLDTKFVEVWANRLEELKSELKEASK